MGKAMNTKRAYHMTITGTWMLGYFTPAKGRSQAELTRLLARVWRNEAPDQPAPSLVFGAGDRSWYWVEEHQIKIANHQRCYDTMLHEITHALGHHTHGPKFITKYINLLAKYARCDELKLLTYAKLIGYKI
jgi:hypothetical protein